MCPNRSCVKYGAPTDTRFCQVCGTATTSPADAAGGGAGTDPDIFAVPATEQRHVPGTPLATTPYQPHQDPPYLGAPPAAVPYPMEGPRRGVVAAAVITVLVLAGLVGAAVVYLHRDARRGGQLTAPNATTRSPAATGPGTLPHAVSGSAVNIAGEARISAPPSAANGKDGAGNPTSYGTDHLSDGALGHRMADGRRRRRT